MNETKIVNTTIINCGTSSSYSCFINASKTCHPAVWNYSAEVSLLGVISTSIIHYEIKGYSSDAKCIYYEKRLAGSLVYTDAFVNNLLQQGYTTAQVNKMQQDAQYQMSSFNGAEKICKFNRVDLTNLFIKWQDGSFSTSDYNNAECYPHGTFDCKLDFVDNMQIAGVSLSTMDYLQSITISVKGFTNSSKIYWRVENSSVIRLSSLIGNYSNIYPLKIGKTFIIIKDTSLSSCELKTPFEVFEENSSDVPVCDNDNKCEWKDDETISNCPHDCIGDSSFFSNHTCEWSSDCDYYEEYPVCVLDTCAKPTQALKNFIEQNYETGNCSAISCNNCQLAKLHATGVGYYGFEVEFCTECSKESSVFPCKEGYVCERGLCVPINTVANPGTLSNQT
jgi:hypothetical protein